MTNSLCNSRALSNKATQPNHKMWAKRGTIATLFVRPSVQPNLKSYFCTCHFSVTVHLIEPRFAKNKIKMGATQREFILFFYFLEKWDNLQRLHQQTLPKLPTVWSAHCNNTANNMSDFDYMVNRVFNNIIKIYNMVYIIVTIEFTILSNLTTLLTILLQYYFVTILWTKLRAVNAN